jgi:hypothetical protein
VKAVRIALAALLVAACGRATSVDEHERRHGAADPSGPEARGPAGN